MATLTLRQRFDLFLKGKRSLKSSSTQGQDNKSHVVCLACSPDPTVYRDLVDGRLVKPTSRKLAKGLLESLLVVPPTKPLPVPVVSVGALLSVRSKHNRAVRRMHEAAASLRKLVVQPKVTAWQAVLMASCVVPPLPLALWAGRKLYRQVRDGLFQIIPVGGTTAVGDALLSLHPEFSHSVELVRAGGASAPAGVVFARLRPRARWVRALETCLGGRKGVVASFLGRRWTPDLADRDRADVQNYLLGTIEGGARLLGGGVVEVGDVERGERSKRKQDHVYFIVDTGAEEASLVFPELLGRLRTYALYRKRDGLLLGALRTRAQGWCKAMGLRAHIMDLAVAAATSMAMMPSTHERVATSYVHRVVSGESHHAGDPLLQ